ncbi:MAG: hypothetical protein KA371_00015 [Acidobacteria bacterium]|nr:hypothetical protein [Acidobacteriota bacterium]
MTRTRAIVRPFTLAAASLLLSFSTLSGPAAAQERDHDKRGSHRGDPIVGTWFMTTPLGWTGIYTFHQDGTWTGVVSLMFGAPPQAPTGATNASMDHGVWRRKGHVIEGAYLRFRFNQITGDPVQVARVRTLGTVDRGGNTSSGTWIADRWDCPGPLACPDPNTTPPDAVFEPLPPLNSFTMTRLRLP